MIADVLIDPLKIYQRLKAAKVDEKAAEEIAAIFGDVLDTQLATKKDIAVIQQDISLIRKDIANLQSETKKDIELFRNETKSNIEQLRNETKSNIEQLRNETKNNIEQLRNETKSDIELLRNETKSNIALVHKDIKELETKLEAKIESSKAEMLKWTIGLIVAQTGIILTFFKLLK
ncbi:MAG: DUF1640 domain-containing protein [Leptospiraceae bacterium]|nr:DUF1640 domain-containing protein [Leptospiraceae bacterium]